jgi:hypothetical protein
VAELDAALKALSTDAHAHLQAKLPPMQPEGEKPFTADSLQYSIYKFQHENRWGLESAPAAKLGAPVRNHEWLLVSRLRRVFSLAHGGERPTRGWPKFLGACTKPLTDFGLPRRSDKSWQDMLRKRRNNNAQNR